MQTRSIAPSGISIQRVHAVVNPASGSVGPETVEELSAFFADWGLDFQISQLEPRHSEAVVRQALDTDPDLVVVMGGDGTARLVGEMCGPMGPLVAPLSGGTMNKLGRALYGAMPWREALADALADGAPRWVPGGEVQGHAFFCRAVLGPPALWARAREAVRVRKLGRAWRRAVVASHKAFQSRLCYQFDSGIGHGMAIGLICPTVSRALRDDEGALEAAVLDLTDAKGGVRLALANLLGDWRDDPDVTVRPCIRGRAWAHDPMPAMLDGEFFQLGRQAEIRFRPSAFRALAPLPDADGVV